MPTVPKIFAFGTVAFLAGCVVDTPSQPTIADGVYNLDPESCNATTSGTRLSISGSEFRFYESSCRMQPGQSGAEGLQARLICTGEGEEWERRVTLQGSADLLTIREGENSYRYHRCS